MVDQYYKKIESVENDIENAMVISSILLKLKGYDDKLDELSKINDNSNNISTNLGKISTNKNDISDNLEKINNNETNISTNLGKISTNKNDISDNLEKINNNETNISTNLEKISTNKNDISDNLEKINNNETNISTNLGKISTNKNDISDNLEKINNNETNISTNLGKINDIKSILPKSEIFKKTYSIKNQSFRFTRNIIYFKLLETEIKNNFNKDGRLEFDNYIYYRYDNLQKDHHRLQHEYHIYDDKNNLLYKKILNKTNTSDLNFDNNIMLVKDNFYVNFNNNYNKITIVLYLFRVYRHGAGNFNLALINENFVNIIYLDRNDISLKIDKNKNDISSNLSKIDENKNDISSNLSKIDENKNDISTNLIKINSNEDDILSNSSEINYLKNNSSKSYLKNIYNILLYDRKTQVSFKKYFFEKVFDVNASINDFVEMSFRISLEYENISERAYVKTLYELFDENDNSLYIKSVNNNDYSYYQNKIFIDENIFYNFTKNIKKIKFVIKFQMILSRVINVWYIKNNNYRLVIKNYGV